MIFARMALVVLMGFWVSAHLWGQELRVQCQPDQRGVLFGEPVYATYRITNDSQIPVYIGAVEERAGKVVVLRYKARAVGPKGEVPVREAIGEPQARFRLDPGKEVQIHQPLPITDVTLPELPEGSYELRFVLPYSLEGDGGGWEKAASCVSGFSILLPQGEDAGWLEALQQAARTAEKKQLRRPSAESPVNWHEVLEGTVEGIVPQLLTKFPTSTYAGYVLGLGEGFPVILDSKPEYVVETLWQENYLQSHPLATLKTEGIQREAQKQGKRTVPMRGYLEEQRSKIERYLAVHPNHARREIMELARAYQSLALGDKDTAVRSLEWVAGQAPSEKWRNQAQAILALLKQEK